MHTGNIYGIKIIGLILWQVIISLFVLILYSSRDLRLVPSAMSGERERGGEREREREREKKLYKFE